MQSATLPKIMHPLCGQPILGHVLDSAKGLNPENLVVVIGHMVDKVAAYLAGEHPEARVAVDHVQNGTGLALKTGLSILEADKLSGTVLALCGDTPLVTGETLQALLLAHESEGNAATVLTAIGPNPEGCGRLVRDINGAVVRIVEHDDASEEQLKIREINSGLFAFDGALLPEVLDQIGTVNSRSEEYLTDAVSILHSSGHRVGAVVASDYREISGINDRIQLATVRRFLNDRLLESAMRKGVTIIDPASTWLDIHVTCEPDVTLHQNTRLRGCTRVASGAEIGPDCTLTDTFVGAGARVTVCTAERTHIDAGAHVGPYVHLPPSQGL
ncbi:NTP transferase domain-containing protein [Streptomyces sp. NPDC051554]|uniref:NTP transferase domain-containing protein n=1 Tax=Streptomyces sp. NPDC051554 TaxID=3365656 RepID=UPI0037A3BEE3